MSRVQLNFFLVGAVPQRGTTIDWARICTVLCIIGWRRGEVVSGVRRMNEVNARRAGLVPGWVTVFGRVYHHLGM